AAVRIAVHECPEPVRERGAGSLTRRSFTRYAVGRFLQVLSILASRSGSSSSDVSGADLKLGGHILTSRHLPPEQAAPGLEKVDPGLDRVVVGAEFLDHERRVVMIFARRLHRRL